MADRDKCNALIPREAEVVSNIKETSSIFTLKLRFTDTQQQQSYVFSPGQFNMLYLPGVGEVAISIVSDPDEEHLINHTIRNVGRVTAGMAALKSGQRIGLRGPFGKGWPLDNIMGKDIVVVTGGLGCAPVVSMINYMCRRREQFGKITIIQGVKHADDLIWRTQYESWQSCHDTWVLLAADQGGVGWPFHTGLVTDLLSQIKGDPRASVVMMCGPEGMMHAAAIGLLTRGYTANSLYLSMERNMQCAVGHCGHCQYGAAFICKDGPVFNYPDIAHLLGKRGF
jgi:sulfhydrogenase subunit gamma (sulfur reductase)